MKDNNSIFDHWVDKQLLDQTVDSILFYWLLAGGVALVSSLVRIIETGWLAVYALHILLFLFLFTVYVFRSGIQARIKAFSLIILSILVGILGLLNFGMMTGGIFFFAVAGILLALFYSIRTIIVFGVCILGVLFFSAAGHLGGFLELTLPANQLHMTVSHWLTYIVAFTLFFVVGIAIMTVYRKVLFGLVGELEKQRKHIAYIASHDLLTGLPLRNLLNDRMQMAINRADRYDSKVVVLFVDLDNFKCVNDDFGHDIGDQCLKVTSQRMKELLRAEDTVARLGGDEFVIVIDKVVQIKDVETLAGKLLTAIYEPMDIDEHRIQMSASIGIAIYPDNAKTIQDLIKVSDMAMYKAKSTNKNNYCLYEDNIEPH